MHHSLGLEALSVRSMPGQAIIYGPVETLEVQLEEVRRSHP